MRRYIIIGFIVGVAAVAAFYMTRPSSVEKAVESAFIEFIVSDGAGIDPQDFGGVPEKALLDFKITGEQLAAALATNSGPTAFGIGVLALSAKDLSADMLEAEMRQDFTGRPLACGIVMVHLCPSLKNACSRGLKLLAGGGRLAAVGHVMLCHATLQPVEPKPDSFRKDSIPPIDPKAWDFLRSLKPEELTYETLFIRSLSEARRDEGVLKTSRVLQAARQLVFDVGQPTKGDLFYSHWSKMMPEDIGPWVKSMRHPITLATVKNRVWTQRDLLIAYLFAAGQTRI